jgi:lipoprotein-anchoring transpeptidase ErfK/SrfK
MVEVQEKVRSVRCFIGILGVGAGLLGCTDGSSESETGDEAEAPALEPASSAGPRAPEKLGPRVTLDGKDRALPATVARAGSPRIHSRSLRAWVYEKPNRDSRRLGYLRAGSSSPTSDKPAGHLGCKGGWFPVEPRGYLCRGARATLEADDPIVHATEHHPPSFSRKLPYIYGTVRNPGLVFQRLPTDEELRRIEPDFVDRMPRWLEAGGEIGASYAQEVWLGGSGSLVDPTFAFQNEVTEDVPAFLAQGKNAPNMYRKPRDLEKLALEPMRPRVGYSFLKTFLHRGRRYGLTPDLKLLPTDRLRPIRGSDFRGVEIGKDVTFPFAFVRQPGAKFWIYQGSSGRLIDAGAAPYRAALKLTGKQRFVGQRLYYETEGGKWLSDLDASRLDPAKRMPGWGKRGQKWIDVNLTKQTLMLYEGEQPVYATLISSGEAGLEDPKHTTATKRGIFRIHTKHVTATMSSDEVGEEFELRDVPYVQYFDKEGYALHGAYWHDRFGIPKSHGCINLAPEDARRIFSWTEPEVPIGWHGALSPLEGTVMFVHP